jgi:hypothetical protein
MRENRRVPENLENGNLLTVAPIICAAKKIAWQIVFPEHC